jgi:hypothetical protein
MMFFPPNHVCTHGFSSALCCPHCNPPQTWPQPDPTNAEIQRLTVRLAEAERERDRAIQDWMAANTRSLAAEASLREAREVLREVEWDRYDSRCPCCDRGPREHAPDCRLAAVLAGSGRGGEGTK